jgi:hypothetical protein
MSIGGMSPADLQIVVSLRRHDHGEPRMKASEATFRAPTTDVSYARKLPERLSELGRRIWDAIQRDDQITELFFELADEKLARDKVSLDDSRLDSDAAGVIMGMDYDPETRERLRSDVPSREWLKYSLYNFALDWVMDQALMRMKIEQKWPFQEEDGFPKP